MEVLLILLEHGINNLVGLSSVSKDFRRACWGREANYFVERRLVYHSKRKHIVHLQISNRLRIGSPIIKPWQVKIYKDNKLRSSFSYSDPEIVWGQIFKYKFTIESYYPGSNKTNILFSILTKNACLPARCYSTPLYSSTGIDRSRYLRCAMGALGIGQSYFGEKMTIDLGSKGTYFNWLLATFR